MDGSLTTNDNIKIDGRVIGSVSTRGDIVIADTGFVGGDLYGNNIYIEGEIKGKVTARSNLVLGATAKIHGEIKFKSLATEDGANFHEKNALEVKHKTDTTTEMKTVFQAKIQSDPMPKKSNSVRQDRADISNVTIRNISTSSHVNPLPQSNEIKSEEEEKKAFLKTFYFDPEE